MRKACVVAAIFFSVVCLLTLTVGASASVDVPDEDEVKEGIGNFTDSIPEDIGDLLPDGLFSGDISIFREAVDEMSRPDYLINLAISLISGGMGDAAGLLAALLGLTALSALCTSLRQNMARGGMADALSLVSAAAVAVAATSLTYPRLSAAAAYFERLRTLMAGILPLMGALYLSGGNVTAAAVNNTSVMLWLNLVNIVASGVLLPAVSVCVALALADAFRPQSAPSLAGVSGMIKRTLTFMLGLGGTLLAASLGAQSVLAASTDSVGARAVRFMAGNMIPVVGSTVGDTLRTVAASVKLLRATVGVAGIAVIAVMLLPSIVSLLLTRLAFSTASATAELLGCNGEKKLFGEMASLYGYLIAASALVSLLFVFALTVFALTASAAGGAS